MQLCAAYKRLTSALRIHIDETEEIEKDIPHKWEPKESRQG